MYEGTSNTNAPPPSSALNSGDYGAYAYRKWCGIRRSTWLLVTFVLTYLAFLVVGGYLMGVIEEENERRLVREAHEAKREFIRDNPNVNGRGESTNY